MPTAKKAEAIEQLTEKLRGAKAVVITDYRGMPTPELNTLRTKLRAVNGEYFIAKNTLTVKAVQNIGITGADAMFEGPTAMAISTSKESELAKALLDYIRTSRTILKIRGGILGQQALTIEEVRTLATLPAKPRLQAVLAGNIQGPLSGFVGLLNSALGELVRVFDEREKQLAGSAEPA